MLKSTYNTAQSYSTRAQGKRVRTVSHRIDNLPDFLSIKHSQGKPLLQHMPGAGNSPKHLLSTAYSIAQNFPTPQESAALRRCCGMRQEENKTRVFLHQGSAALCTLHLQGSNRQSQTTSLPTSEEMEQLNHSTCLLFNFKQIPLLWPLTILERNSDF